MGGIKVTPLTAPAPYAASELPDFGRVVEGFAPKNATPEDYKEIEDLLYKHSILVFHGVDVDPEAQLALTKWFDKQATTYGHGNNKTGKEVKSILHPDLKTLPNRPEVQLIGNGVPEDHRITQGLEKPRLKHPNHQTFHKTTLTSQQEDEGLARYYRWHIDSALYDQSKQTPVATTLYALSVPAGRRQTIVYDDGTGDKLDVPLGTTAFVSGTNMFDILSPEYKSLAVRSKVQYMPHPYVAISDARAMSTGLGIESEGRETPKEKLPAWTESQIQTLPMTWKNPVTGLLHFQVHPCGVEKIIVDPLPADYQGDRSKALYPDGTTISDLKEARELLYKLQRPAIAPKYVYAHDWKQGDLCLFHNRGVLHTVCGHFHPDEVRAFWQCNLASAAPPAPPSKEDVAKYA
ncbi:hypothetical protein EMMF5_003653 [Cystobasidiomycetes sp. EMM_F5]